MKIAFLGSPPEYSQLVKKALIKANYELTDDTTQADLLVIAAHGQILTQEILNRPKYGAINLHPSLLPLHRGATPVPQALLNQDKQTGISLIKMIRKIDAGPILAQQIVDIKPDDNTQTLLLKCFSLGADLLIKILPSYLDGSLKLTPQSEKSPTPMTYKLNKKDGFIPWPNFSTYLKTNFTNLSPKIKAYYPWPGVFTTMPNNKILKILPNHLLQLEGKQPISIKQFLSGYQHLLK